MQACGERWQIEVCRGGYSLPQDSEAEVERCKEHVGISLNYEGDSEALRTKFTITLVNQLPGKQDHELHGKQVTYGQVSNDTTATVYGFYDFIQRSELEDETNGWKIDDRVIIRATITTFGALESTVAAGPAAAAAVFNPPETWRTDAKTMLASGRASDIALYVGPREFAAHRTILRMRSPYFDGLFASSMEDAGRWDRCAILYSDLV